MLYLEALNQYRYIQNDEGEIMILRRLSTVYRKMKKFDKAKKLCDRAWHLAQDLGRGDVEALINTAYGKLARDMQNWSLAWQYYSKVQEWFEQRAKQRPSDEELIRSLWGHLGLIAYHLGRPQEAKELCSKSLEFFELYGSKGFLATLNYRIALAEAALDEHEAALKHAKHALEWFERLGMRPDYVEAKRLVDELVLKVSE